MKFTQLLLLLLSFSLFYDCYKDHDDLTEEEYEEDTTVYVDTHLFGDIPTGSGELLAEYTLAINGQSHSVTGKYFSIHSKNIHKMGAVITAYKNGRTAAIGTFTVIENDYNKIQLHEFSQSTTESTAGSFTHDLRDGLSIQGNNQSGTLNIGYLQEDNSVPVFSTYGELLLAEQVDIISVESSTSVPTGTQFNINVSGNNTPEIYTLKDGRWRQVAGDEAFANLSPGIYLIGQTRPAVLYEAAITQEDHPVSYMPVAVNGGAFSGRAFSTMKGKYGMIVPEKSGVNLSFLNSCNDILREETTVIEDKPVSETFDLEVSKSSFYKIETSVITCNGKVASEPTLIINDATTQHYTFGEAIIDHLIPVCGEDFRVNAVNINASTMGNALTWSKDRPAISFLNECDELKEGYIYLQVDDDDKIYKAYTYEAQGEKTGFSTEAGEAKLKIDGMIPGVIMEDRVNLFLDDPGLGKGYYVSCINSDSGCGIDEFYLSHYNTENGFIRATFKGKIWMKRYSPVRADYFDVSGCVVIME